MHGKRNKTLYFALITIIRNKNKPILSKSSASDIFSSIISKLISSLKYLPALVSEKKVSSRAHTTQPWNIYVYLYIAKTESRRNALHIAPKYIFCRSVV